MTIARWYPHDTPTKQEQFILKRLQKSRRLFAFLFEVRRQLFDDDFQVQLEGMYRDTGAGRPALPPAKLAMATILQGYTGSSDAETVELTMVDLRWQLVLECLGSTTPAFSQGSLHDFRQRMIKHGMDKLLLERTAQLARTVGGFDPKKLPTSLCVAMDSAPLEGAGRVEDTINLLGHAARNVAQCVAVILNRSLSRVCKDAGAPVLLASSIKAGLDVEWSNPASKKQALGSLVGQIESLQRWVEENLKDEAQTPPISEMLATLQRLMNQDLEPDPNSGGKRIRKGVAPDRQVSVSDPDMRHGRKSKSRRFNGYKRHIATDLATQVILSCAITPANIPEQEAASILAQDITAQGMQIRELHIDRGYITSALVGQILRRSGDVLCKPWVPRAKLDGMFTKLDFDIDLHTMTIGCPAGQVESIEPGRTIEFDAETCDHCRQRNQCTMAAAGAGRTVAIAHDEALQQLLRQRIATSSGREQLRRRVGIEHSLAHVVRRQGHRARYRGERKNLYDLRRASAVQNLELWQREFAA